MAKKSIRKQIISMKKGESLTFEIDRIQRGTVQTYASDLGYFLNRKYQTRRDREARTIIVSRLA